MITNQELRNLVTEWQLRDDVIEKDYVIGWLLWGIGSDPDLGVHWAFKGGTSLKKCYVETWRFSEDLDFTIIPGGPDKPETGEVRAYRVDRIQSIKVTTRVFRPRYRIEFSSSGGIHAIPTERKSGLSSFGYGLSGRSHRTPSRSRTANPFGMRYIFQCNMCMKKFTKSTNDSTLRAHKNSFGMPCSGRHGYLVGNK